MRKFTENNKNFFGNRADLYTFLEQFNINIISIPIDINFKKIKNIIKLCDGIIMPGGSSFHPNDFLLVDYLYQKDIPTLGICLGMQAMGEHFNNHQENKVSNHNLKANYAHYVTINKTSLLYKILKKDNIMVNSRHNYCLPNTTLKVNAYSKEGIIEGIEDNTKKFFLGVEWHPESLNDTNSYTLIKYFINIL